MRKRQTQVNTGSVEMVSVDQLKTWDSNPRRNDEAARMLAKIISNVGFRDPIIATRDGVIRAGHTRLKAAIKLGMTEVPVIYQDFDSEEDAIMFSLSHNKADEWSTWENSKLGQIFQELSETAPDCGINIKSGFKPVEIEVLMSPYRQAGEDFHALIEQFSQEYPRVVEKHFWCWVIVPDEESYNKLVEKYGKKSKTKMQKKSREMDWEKFKEVVE